MEYNGEYVGPDPTLEVKPKHVTESGTFTEELMEAFKAVEAMMDRVKFDGRIIYANYGEIIEKFGPYILVAAKRYWDENISEKF